MSKLIFIFFLALFFSVASMGCQRNDDYDPRKQPMEDTTTPHSLNKEGVGTSENFSENNKIDEGGSFPNTVEDAEPSSNR